jgi:ribosomal protein S18 acetylase RimI-like enzyme
VHEAREAQVTARPPLPPVTAAVAPRPGEDADGVRIASHTGPREHLRPLFELAEDSAAQLDSYVGAGRVLVAVSGEGVIGHLQLVDGDRPGEAEIKNMAVLEAHQGRGVGGRLVRAAIELVAAEGGSTVLVATAAADIGNLRFYQRQGFRMRSIERDAFTAETGYEPGIVIDGIGLRDRVWLDHSLDAAGGIPARGEVSPPSGRPKLAPRKDQDMHMYHDRSPLFCDTALAGRIERAEAELVTKGSEAASRRGAGGFVIPIAGAVASYAEQDSPLNKVAGLGFGGVPTVAALDGIERAFAGRGAPVQIELAHLADPAIGALVTGRGYRLTSYENVLGRSLRDEPARVTPAGVEVRRSGDEEFEQWLEVVSAGVAHPDTQGVPSHEEFPPEVIARAMRDLAAAGGVVRYAALLGGVIAGGASLRIAEGVAQLTGAATAPAHRRRGVQTALLSARLAAATAAGCDIAVVATQPGSKSQQNVQRQGFDLLYTRAILVKQP